MSSAVQTYTATIYVGLRQGRTAEANSVIHTVDEVRKVCREYCDRIGLCVSITETEFVYTGGGERGVAIGLINYPRYPSNKTAIRTHAICLARALKSACGQIAVSIVCPDRTVMIDDTNVAPRCGSCGSLTSWELKTCQKCGHDLETYP